MSSLIPPPPQSPGPSGYVPYDPGDLRRSRPGAVTAVVVISYVQAGLAFVVAAAFLVIAAVASGDGTAAGLLVVSGVVVGAIGILVGFAAYRIGRGSRGWRTAYLVLTGIGVVFDLVNVLRQPSALIAMGISVLCMVLLLSPSSRAWFNSAR